MRSFNKRSLIALLLALAVLVTLFCVGVSAEEDAENGDGETTVAVNDNESTTTGASDEDPGDTTDGSTTADAEETTTAEAEESTTAASTTGSTSSSSDNSNMPAYIVSIVVAGLAIALGLFFGIRNRVKLGAFLRSVRSEIKKKIAWSSFKDTKKNTIVVLVVVIIIAIVIFILDSAFGYGIKYLREFVQGLI